MKSGASRVVIRSVAIVLALVACFTVGWVVLVASAPGITEVTQNFPVHTGVPASQKNMMSATTTESLFFFSRVDDDCGTFTFRVAGDPDRLATVNGNPVPSEGYVLLSRLRTCDQGSTSSDLELTVGPAVGATRLGDGHTRFVVAVPRSEGGCAHTNQLGGPECTLGVGAVHLNGDSDWDDVILQYLVLDLDPAAKNLTVAAPLVNTGWEADSPSLATDGTMIAWLRSESAVKDDNCTVTDVVRCYGAPFPYGTDLNGDGMVNTSVLYLLDVTTGAVRQTPLSHSLSMSGDFATGTDRVQIGGGIVAFSSDEAPGRDYNGDGDYKDRAVRFFSVADPIPTVRVAAIAVSLDNTVPGGPGPNTGVVGTDGRWIAYVGTPTGGFSNEQVLHVYDVASNSIINTGAWVSEGMMMPHATDRRVANGIATFVTEEFRLADFMSPPVDRNNDGDYDDIFLRFFDIPNKRVVTSDLATVNRYGASPTPERVLLGTDGHIAAVAEMTSGVVSFTRFAEGVDAGGGGGGGTTADVGITMADSPDPATVGLNLTYMLAVANDGPGEAANVNVTVIVPSAASVTSVMSSAGTCTMMSPVTCALGTVPNGASATITISVTPVAPGTLDASATVSSTQTDPVSANNIAQTSTTAIPAGGGGPTCSIDVASIASSLGRGAARLQSLQLTDGGWQWTVGSGGSAANMFGVTALGLLDAYARTSDPATLAAAVQSGNALVATYAAQNPKQRPYTSDVEFLVALGRLTGDNTYTTTAADWFAVVVSQYPNPASRVDAILAGRSGQGYRSMAAWDVASVIRAAKVAGNIEYARGATVRIIQREVDIVEGGVTLKGWKDTDPTHRWDQCSNPGGCGQTGNLYSFDYTLLGEGALLTAFYDLEGFDSKRAEYRDFLTAQQDPGGSWDAGDMQMTAYITRGLSATAPGGVDDAVLRAACFLTGYQLANGGWPTWADPLYGVGAENSELTAEAMAAVGRLFSTPVGSNVTTAPSPLVTASFAGITSPGTTAAVAIDASMAGALPGGFSLPGNAAFDVSSSAQFVAPITVCFTVPAPQPPQLFSHWRALHNENGILVDRTILAPDSPAPDPVARTICARVDSLSPFVIAEDVDDPPAASAQQVTVAEDASTAITLAATDPEGDAVSYAIVSGPAHGTLSGAAPNLTYAPAAHYNGADSFTFTASDASRTSAAATVSISVLPVNDPPVASSQAVTTAEDTSATIGLTATDIDLDPLTFAIATAPLHGTIVVAGNVATYVPNANYNGSDSFTFRASDGSAMSEPALVTIAVRAVNDPPIATNRSATTVEGTPVTINLVASDVDGDALTFAVGAPPLNGTLTLAGGTATYVPAANYVGSDSFTFVVSDGQGGAATGTVDVVVTGSSAGSGRMNGDGFIDANGRRHEFQFEVRRSGNATSGRLQYRARDVRAGASSGTRDEFMATVVPSVIFTGQAVHRAQFIGAGIWRGQSGYTFEAIAVDAGEPGRRDTFALTIRNAGGAIVAAVSGNLAGGNVQSTPAGR